MKPSCANANTLSRPGGGSHPGASGLNGGKITGPHVDVASQLMLNLRFPGRRGARFQGALRFVQRHGRFPTQVTCAGTDPP